MIRAIVGLPGAGKTLYCVKIAQEYLKDGYLVACNFRIHNCQYTFDVEELIAWVASGDPRGPDYIPRIAIIDELNNLFNARDWDKLDPRVRLALSQHRKAGKGNMLYYTTQSFGYADKYFRSITAEMFVVRRFIKNLFLSYRYFPGQMSSDNEFIPKQKQKHHGLQIFNGKKFYDLYDTYERIIQKTAGNQLGGENCLTLSDYAFPLVKLNFPSSTKNKTSSKKLLHLVRKFGSTAKAILLKPVTLKKSSIFSRIKQLKFNSASRNSSTDITRSTLKTGKKD